MSTRQTASGTSIIMNLPTNYQGQVYTYFNGTNWQTYATSSPLSSKQL